MLEKPLFEVLKKYFALMIKHRWRKLIADIPRHIKICQRIVAVWDMDRRARFNREYILHQVSSLVVLQTQGHIHIRTRTPKIESLPSIHDCEVSGEALKERWLQVWQPWC